MDQLNRTPLYKAHVDLSARMVPFAGWEMPVQYSGILAEHKAVRSAVGMFDVSHMGRLEFAGGGAEGVLQKLVTQDVRAIPKGRAKYGFLCQPDGGTIDDIVVLRLEDTRFLLVCNASNREKVVAWIVAKGGKGAACMMDVTLQTAMIAVQGPRAMPLGKEMFGEAVMALPRYGGLEAAVKHSRWVVSRTGYTGEDGFEVVLPGNETQALWKRLLDSGVVPCGLGARDTLRLEAGMPLYGNDIDSTTNPIEAGLERFVKLDKEDFIGREALLKAQQNGVQRKLVGFQSLEKGAAPRHGYAILDGQKAVGHVTSGSYSPTLDKNIGLGYIPVERANPGTRLKVDVRGKAIDVVVVKLPFYSRQKP